MDMAAGRIQTSSQALSLLLDNGFKVFSSWDSLARELNVPIDARRQLRHSAANSGDYAYALEESLDYWMKNDQNHSWKTLVMAVGRTDEKEAAFKLRALYNITEDPVPFSSQASLGNKADPQAGRMKSFLHIQERLQPLLQLSLNEFASKCFSKGLVSMEVYEKLFDHSPSSDSERTKYLIYVIYKRAESLEANGRWSEARNVIQKFGETVYGVDSVLRYIGTEIMALEDSQSLMSKQDRIKSSIQSSLTSIAVKLMSQDMITDEEYDAATDPDSDSSKRHLTEIFRTLREVIKQDYQKYQTLLQVLREMGPPISTAASKVVEAN